MRGVAPAIRGRKGEAMSAYKTTPNEEAMMRGATMRRSEGAERDGKGQSVVIQPLLYVYPDGGVDVRRRRFVEATPQLSQPRERRARSRS
jgi:hypothetical protein